MAERYNKLYSLPARLYAAGSPVLISAGALLKDNQSGNVLCQLKFRSISPGIIKALKLLIVGYDMSNAEVCRVEHQYLDLSIKRNGVFGAKEAIPLPERSVRSYKAQVLAVFFADGSSYYARPNELWESLPELTELSTRLFDRELIRQYRLETTEQSEYVPMEYKDRWFCTCGEINLPQENCFSCGMELEDLKYKLNVDALLDHKNERLSREAFEASQKENSRERSARLIKRALLLLIPVLIIAGCAMFIVSRLNQRDASYQAAMELYNAGQYAEAAQAFDELGKYKEAEAKADAARAIMLESNSYEKAKKFLENGRYDDAYNAFSAMGNYEDAATLAQESLYQKAKSLTGEGLNAEAQQLFRELGDYRDSALLAERFHMLKVQEESSFDAQCNGPLTTSFTYNVDGRVKTKTLLLSAYPGMKDRVLEYTWNGDGSYTETEGDTVREYDTWGILQSENGVSVGELEYEYYESGEIRYVCKLAVDGSIVSGTMYDEQGNPIGIADAEKGMYSISNEYDDEGRLTKTETFDAGGNFLSRTSYEYDEEGRLKRSTYMDMDNKTAVVNYSYELLFAPEMLG